MKMTDQVNAAFLDDADNPSIIVLYCIDCLAPLAESGCRLCCIGRDSVCKGTALLASNR